MNYTIDPQVITLSKKVTLKQVSISGWGNRRYLYIDYQKNVSYFQVTSESNGCHRCGICQERMEKVGWKTGYHFYNIKDHFSLYQKLSGVPKDLSTQSLKDFLDLPLVD